MRSTTDTANQIVLSLSLDKLSADTFFFQLADAIAERMSLYRPAISHKPMDLPNPAGGPSLMTLRDVAKALKVSEKTVWNMRVAGRIPAPIKIGRCLRWDPKALDAWIAKDCEGAADR